MSGAAAPEPQRDLVTGRIGLGAMDLSESPRDDAAAAALLHRAVDRGIALLDTADRYGHGHNEDLIGRTLSGRRGEFRLCTKIGFVGRPGDSRPVDNRPDHLRRACDASLARLRTDHVDLLVLHRVDPEVPLEDSIGTMAQLQAAGKTRSIGVSEVGPKTLRAAHAVHPLDALQIEYSLASRDTGDTLLPVCRELGIELHASSPLAIGLLGTASSTHAADHPQLHPRFRRGPRAASDARRANAERLAELEAIAAGLDCTAPQLALAWLVHRGPDVVALPGTRSLQHLEANIAAGALRLDAATLERLDRCFPVGAFRGARKSPPQMRLTLP